MNVSALFFDNTNSGDCKATLLGTPNYVIGEMPDVTYEKRKHLIGERTRLYIFSDGIYEVDKSDGSMWRFQEYTGFMNKIGSKVSYCKFTVSFLTFARK